MKGKNKWSLLLVYAFTFLTYVAFFLFLKGGGGGGPSPPSQYYRVFYPTTIHLDYSQLSLASQTAFDATMNVNVAGSVTRTEPPQNRSGPNIIVSSRDAFMNSPPNTMLLTVTAFSSSFQYKLSDRDNTGKVV